MKTSNLKLLGALLAALLFGSVSAETLTADGGLVYTTSGDVVPGEWTSQYSKAKALADSEGVPLVAFWANPGCGYCQRLQRVVKTTTVTSWFKKRGYYLVFGFGTTGEGSTIKSFTRVSSGEFPYLAFYWKKPGKTAVKNRYSGRSGSMAVTTGTLTDQFLGTALVNFPDPILTLEMVGDGTGTVTGGGPYCRETSVTLAAKAASGNVFVGWYADASVTEPYPDEASFRSPTFTYVTGTNDVTLYARFVTAATDVASLSIDTEENYVAAANGAFELKVPLSSFSTPKAAVKGLPSGLKFDATTGTISGTAKKPGLYTVTVSATNKSQTKAITKSFVLEVPNLTSSYLTGLLPARDAYPISVGVRQNDLLDLTATDGYVVTSVTGLPSGLSFNRKTGQVAGVPTRAGTYTVYVTAKQGKIATTASVTIVVAALPVWSIGTFNGARTRGETTDGLVTVGIGSTGKISGKILTAGTTWTVSATSLTDVDSEKGIVYADVLVKQGKVSWTNHLAIAESEIVSGQGVLLGETETDGLAWTAYLNQWKTASGKSTATTLAKVPLLTSADGLTLKTKSSGTALVKYLGYSCSTVLIPKAADEYRVFVYFPPKKTSRVNFDGFSRVLTLVENGGLLDWGN